MRSRGTNPFTRAFVASLNSEPDELDEVDDDVDPVDIDQDLDGEELDQGDDDDGDPRELANAVSRRTRGRLGSTPSAVDPDVQQVLRQTRTQL